MQNYSSGPKMNPRAWEALYLVSIHKHDPYLSTRAVNSPTLAMPRHRDRREQKIGMFVAIQVFTAVSPITERSGMAS